MKKEKRNTILIKGAFGEGNFGDDALMTVIYNLLEEKVKNSEITFSCKNQEYFKSLFHGCDLSFSKNQNEDIIVWGGGTQWFGFEGKAQKNLSRKTKQFIKKILLKFVHKTQNSHSLQKEGFSKKQIALGVGFGPFEKGIGEKKAQEIYTQLSAIFVRDPKSYQICKKWGGDKLLIKATDLCYLDSYLPKIKQTHSTQENIRIGIIVRDWIHTSRGASYMNPLLNVVDQLRASQKNVDFILFSKNKDLIWEKTLQDRGEKPIFWDPSQSSIETFMKELSKYDVFISARYHGAIFASLLSKPVICIEIEPKLELIARRLEKGAYGWKYPFLPKKCISSLSKILNNYEETIATIEKKVAEEREIAKKMSSLFLELLLKENK